MLYRAWSEGWGPKFYRVGVTRRITSRARLEWQREREAEAAAPTRAAHRAARDERVNTMPKHKPASVDTTVASRGAS